MGCKKRTCRKFRQVAILLSLGSFVLVLQDLKVEIFLQI